MRRNLQSDVDKLLQEKRVNRLENIAVRTVEISEAWQETGQDFITALIYANLLDYTTDDATGQVVSGSKTDPVKFEEYWTFTRPVGNNPWRLSAIDQK
jgi:predicted lipid-binding transport protein (Tim44 family)